VEEAEAANFETEEQAQAYFDGKLKEWQKRVKMSKRKIKVDEREKVDPYYAMLKREEPGESRMMDDF